MSIEKSRNISYNVELDDSDKKWIRIYIWAVVILGFADFFGISFEVVPFWSIFVIAATIIPVVAYVVVKYIIQKKGTRPIQKLDQVVEVKDETVNATTIHAEIDGDLEFAQIAIKDLEQLRVLCPKTDDETWAKLTKIRKERLFKKKMDIFVAKRNGAIIGEVTANYEAVALEEEAIFTRRSYFEGFRVLEAERGKGIGQQLMKFAIKTLKKEGYYEFTIGVEPDNQVALHIYQKLGFTEKIAHGHGNEFDPSEYDLYLRRDEPMILA